ILSSISLTLTVTLQDKSNFTPQLLGSTVDGTLSKTGCTPPQGGWPTGSGFRVNFVESATALNSILAQSNAFNITPPKASATETSASGSSATTATTATGKSAAGSKFSIGVGFLLLGLGLLQGFVLA
ncbi:hypothetical protein BJ912DRAFT_958316, partial [Pholiota molesta]